jgi:hypothetical protein
LDTATTLSLIVARNDQALLLFYAQIIGDYHRVVGLLMLREEQFAQAIAVLRDAPVERAMQLIYKTAPVLIEKEPDATITMLLSKPQLSFSGVLPALLSYCAALDRLLRLRESNPSAAANELPLDRDFEGNEVNFAMLYMKQALAREGFRFGADVSAALAHMDIGGGDGSGVDDTRGGGGGSSMYGPAALEPALFHTAVWLLARYGPLEHESDDEELVALLDCMQASKVHDTVLSALDIDYDYILRQCRQHKRQRATVRALLLMDCHMEAVRAALALGVKEATGVVLQQQQEYGLDAELLRPLWVEVARAVVAQETDMSAPVALIRQSEGVLTIDVRERLHLHGCSAGLLVCLLSCLLYCLLDLCLSVCLLVFLRLIAGYMIGWLAYVES